jgi:transmembrane sensor
MEKHLFFELIDKYLSGKATAEEQALLEEYYKRLDKNTSSNLTPEQEQTLQQLMLQNIRMKMNDVPPVVPIRNINYFARYAAAAAIIIGFSIGAYLYIKPAKQAAPIALSIKNDIHPGSNKAMLTLSNGRQIALNDAGNGTLAQQGASSVHKTGNGIVAYQVDGNDNNNTGAIDSNTITTPRGGQYKVILPDGTRVWLNSVSSIRFPVAFAGKERKVTTTGEVYFEVTKDKHKPFIVASGGQTVTVLGTHFNVMAYAEEKKIVTTLLEGSVKIDDRHKSRAITPGQQAIVSTDIVVMPADTIDATAWKNGITSFTDADIKTIMRKVSRWYNVDVEYQGQLSDRRFTGGISRKSNLSSLLKILALNHIQFFMEGNKLIVKQ